jgi:hypothetical protein
LLLCIGGAQQIFLILCQLTYNQKEKKILRNQPTRNKNRLWQPCLLTDPDEISNLYRGPSIDASYQVLVHLAFSFNFDKKKFVVEWIVSSMVCWRISSIFYGIFSSPGQRQCELLPSKMFYGPSICHKFKVHKKNPVIYFKKLIIMLIHFKFGHILA